MSVVRVGVSEVWKGLVRDEDVSCVNAHPATHVHTFLHTHVKGCIQKFHKGGVFRV